MTSPRVESSKASPSTVRRRSNELNSVRNTVSGGAGVIQQQDELACLSYQDRQKLLGDFSTQISPEDTLAMKANLMMPWKKLRTMRRYTCMYIHVHVQCTTNTLTILFLKVAECCRS